MELIIVDLQAIENKDLKSLITLKCVYSISTHTCENCKRLRVTYRILRTDLQLFHQSAYH